MSHPDLQSLAEYWLGNTEDDALEEHLLSCDQCSERLTWIVRLGKGITEVARRGNLAWIATPEFLARVASEGLRVRSYAPPAGGGVQCTVKRNDDLLMGRLAADLSQVRRLDIQFTGPEGLRLYLEDVAFRPSAAGEVVMNQPMDFARSVDADTLNVKLISVEQGDPRVIAEYTFHHSRTPE